MLVDVVEATGDDLLCIRGLLEIGVVAVDCGAAAGHHDPFDLGRLVGLLEHIARAQLGRLDEHLELDPERACMPQDQSGVAYAEKFRDYQRHVETIATLYA